jgi:hypothetical protein
MSGHILVPLRRRRALLFLPFDSRQCDLLRSTTFLRRLLSQTLFFLRAKLSFFFHTSLSHLSLLTTFFFFALCRLGFCLRAQLSLSLSLGQQARLLLATQYRKPFSLDSVPLLFFRPPPRLFGSPDLFFLSSACFFLFASCSRDRQVSLALFPA